MATTNFVSGTLIESTWLNDADAHVYDQVTGAHTAANIAVVDAGGKFAATDVEGVLQEIVAGVGGLQYFTEARSIAAPNATVPAHSFTPVGTETNIDAIIAPKGTGALLANIPDGTSAGGDKRGVKSVDLQYHRSASTMVASGWYSALIGGFNNTVSGDYSVCYGGVANTAGNLYTTVIGGDTNNVTGVGSAALGCWQATISGDYSVSIAASSVLAGDYSSAMGGRSCNDNGTNFRMMLGASTAINGTFPALVYTKAQSTWHLLTIGTDDATPKVLATQSAGLAGVTSVTTLKDTSVINFKATIVALQRTTLDTKSWTITGMVKRGTGAATVALVGTPTTTVIAADAGAAAWTVAAGVDTTLGALTFTATGEVAKAIAWHCKVETTELWV